MKNKFTIEIIVAFILVILLFIFIVPFRLLMPSTVVKTIAGISVVVFGLFAGLLLKERVMDEREEKQRAFAGRTAYLIGATVLLVGIIIQVFNNSVDVWLVGSLIAMIVGKIAAYIFSEYYL